MTLALAVAIIAIGADAKTAAADPPGQELQAVREQLEQLRRHDEEQRREIEELKRKLGRILAASSASSGGSNGPASDDGARSSLSPRAALDAALAETAVPAETAENAAETADTSNDVWNRRVGGANLRLIDISADVLFAGGGSTADDGELDELEAGEHDPNRNGFTLQGAELSLAGAVDPYFRSQVHLVAQTDGVELEEAFAQTTSLPGGLQIEAGLFYTEFGVINPRHPHQWEWLDQPVINSRLFGGDGLRAEGLRLGWLTPLSWPSELQIGVQNANNGEFTSSFIGDDPIGGRPQDSRNVSNPGDFLWLARWVNSLDHTDELTSVLGLSALFGPNNAGPNADTWIYGLDYRLKWRPLSNFRGYPFVLWQTEIMRRDYETASYNAAAGNNPDFPNDLPSETLHDTGGYTQLVWGFTPGWSAGVRLEYADGEGDSVEDGALVGHDDDPTRDRRWRFSPLLTWWPSHFSRLRLQYNYDNAKFLERNDAHTVWLGVEALFGAHAAHAY